MAKWLRISLGLVLIIVGAGLWGFFATAMGAPSMVVGLGAVVIGVGIITWISGKNSN